MSSTSWCSPGVTAGRPRGSFARYCKDKGGHLAGWSPTSCVATPRRTGNVAVGLVVGSIFVAVGIAVGLVIGMGLN